MSIFIIKIKFYCFINLISHMVKLNKSEIPLILVVNQLNAQNIVL